MISGIKVNIRENAGPVKNGQTAEGAGPLLMRIQHQKEKQTICLLIHSALFSPDSSQFSPFEKGGNRKLIIETL
jgi:hypothetical protein